MGDAEQFTSSDAAYSPSETTESLSSAQEASSSGGGTSKKRKLHKHSTALHGRGKRLRSFYNDEYRELFNETVIEIASEETSRHPKLLVSQIGATLWSPEEKDVLFCSLARRGRHAIQDIAADVGSKSESEVYIYLRRLTKAAADEQTYEPTKRLPKAFNISAAFEVSQECCASLDVAAETLSLLQQQEEERIEKKKHDSLSMLTPKIAQWASRRLSAGEEGDRGILEALPAADLLNLKTFLALSKRFFMNSSIMENNWRTYKEGRKSPTITYTAFSDFHNLAKSITNRIVQSSLFFAMSRRRALDASTNYKSGSDVRKADVMAALDVLGMESDTKIFWAGVARKCELRVYEKIKHRRASGKTYSYHETEAILSSLPSKARGRSRAASRDNAIHLISQGKDMPDNVPSDSSDDSESSGSLSTGDEESHDHSDSALSTNTINDKQANKQKIREAAQETYAEVLDQRASRAEERRLWELLGEDSAQRRGSEDVELPNMPVAQRKDTEILDDWKAWVNYVTEWEVYESPAAATNFTGNRSLGRSDEPIGDHQSSETEEVNSSVGSDDENVSREANGGEDLVVDELDEPEGDPQHPTPGHQMSSEGKGTKREQMIVDEGHRSSRPSISIASNRDIQNDEDRADSRDTYDTD